MVAPKGALFWVAERHFFVFSFVFLSCVGDYLKRGVAGITSYTEDRSGTITYCSRYQNRIRKYFGILVINNEIQLSGPSLCLACCCPGLAGKNSFHHEIWRTAVALLPVFSGVVS